MSKFLKDRNLTVNQFKIELSNCVEKDMSLPEIAKIYSTSSTTIHNYLKKFNLKRRENLRSKEWLNEKYHKEKLSANEIAKLCNVSYQAVLWHIDKFKIPRRSINEIQKIATKRHHRRSIPSYQIKGSRNVTRGYSVYYKGIYCWSLNEFVFLKHAIDNNKEIKRCNFIFENRNPDFIIGQDIYEIKGNRKDLSITEINDYISYGARLVNNLNYKSYKLYFINEHLQDDYNKYRQIFQDMGAIPGISFSYLD